MGVLIGSYSSGASVSGSWGESLAYVVDRTYRSPPVTRLICTRWTMRVRPFHMAEWYYNNGGLGWHKQAACKNSQRWLLIISARRTVGFVQKMLFVTSCDRLCDLGFAKCDCTYAHINSHQQRKLWGLQSSRFNTQRTASRPVTCKPTEFRSGGWIVSTAVPRAGNPLRSQDPHCPVFALVPAL